MWQKVCLESILHLFEIYHYIGSYRGLKELQYVDLLDDLYTKNCYLQGFKELQYVDLQVNSERSFKNCHNIILICA